VALIAAMTTLVVLALSYPVIFSLTRAPAVLVISIFPLVVVFGAVLNALQVVEEAGSMTSNYPRSMLVLPVRTRTLVLWPMLMLSLVTVLLWLMTATLIYRLSDFWIHLLLPALALAALMAWIQALCWLPIANPLLRVAVIAVSITALGTLPIGLSMSDYHSPALIATLLVVLIAAAYPLGLAAVACDRRGDVLRMWPGGLRPSQVAVRARHSRRRQPYRSSAAAQFWYEWNCHGLMLPGFVFVIGFLISMVTLLGPRRADSFLFPFTLSTVFCLPVASAGALGGGLGQFRPFGVNLRKRFITFVAIRPLNTGALVAAKFRMALLSVLLTWAVVVVEATLWIVVSGNNTNAWGLTRQFLQRYPGGRGIAILALGVVLLPAVTWKFLTDGFALALTHRRWIAEGASYLFLSVSFGLTAAGFWFAQHPNELPRLIAAVPWLVVCGAILKGAVAVGTFRSALRRRLIDWRDFWNALGVWVVVTACAVGMALLVLPAGTLPVSRPIIVLGIATFMPLVRFPLATLALEWNRHR